MPDYRRFITYLFQYRDGKKEKNCGFAKVEVRQKNCRIEIQMKGVTDGQHPVYLFFRKENMPEGVLIGMIGMEHGWGKVSIFLNTENIGESDRKLSDMSGLYISQSETEFVASQWDDGETDWMEFIIYEKEKEQERAHKENEVMASDTGEKSGQADQPEQAENDQEQESSPKDRDMIQSPEMHATQSAAVQPREQQAVCKAGIRCDWKKGWAQQWQRFVASHPVFLPFDHVETIWGVRMQLSDFKVLPKEYWSLANNSFLLHGYFNYRYVLFGYMEEHDGKSKKWFLGVPGVYQNQERMLAGIFGFPEFRTKQEVSRKTGEFGYWYQFLF